MAAPFSQLQILDLFGSNEKGGRTRKRRAINPADTPQRLDIQKTSLDESRKPVAIVDLDLLNPIWGQWMETSQPLIEKHVETLVSDVSRSIRLFDIENRCKASADPILIQRLIDAAGRPDRLQRFAENPTHMQVVDLRMIDMSLSPEGPVGQVILDAGQHRRAAVFA
ncbi:hypothetical protein BDV06DRAFT_218432 [Aspergillus oleicola]